MIKIIIICILFFNTSLLYSDSVIETKTVNGSEYKLIATRATVLPLFIVDNAVNKEAGKSLYLKNRKGKLIIAKISQEELEPYQLNEKIKVYYIERPSELDKQFHRVFTSKNNVLWNAEYSSDPDHLGFSNTYAPTKIEKYTIHTLSSKKPSLKLISEEGGKIYKYVDTTSSTVKYAVFIFIGFATFLFIREGHKGGMTIAVVVSLLSYFIIFIPLKEEKTVFNLNTQRFFKGSTLEKAKINNNFAGFMSIYAFQILKSKHQSCNVDSKTKIKDCFDLYELNLILNDNNRINLICHSDVAQIMKDAKTLSNAINKPILNQIKFDK